MELGTSGWMAIIVLLVITLLAQIRRLYLTIIDRSILREERRRAEAGFRSIQHDLDVGNEKFKRDYDELMDYRKDTGKS